MVITENKNSFFSLSLPISSHLIGNEVYQEKLDNAIDLICSSMGVRGTLYKFAQKQKGQLVYFFKSENRKRKGQLAKYCEHYLPENQNFEARGITSFVFDSELERIRSNLNFDLIDEPSIFSEYNGSDIKLFDDKSNWHSWQKDIYDMIFFPNGSYREPHSRHIYSLVDTKGNSGKSSFFKWLFYNNPQTIGRIGYGSASQLRSSAVNMGNKNLYIVDLARSKSKEDRQEDLLSVLEDLKSGLVTNAMYGSGKTLLIPPPHIIVSSNYILKYELLSADRWRVFEIDSNLKLKKLKPVSRLEVKK